MNARRDLSTSIPHDALVPVTESLLLRPIDAAKLLAISPRKLWEMTTTKEVPSVRIGRSIRYVREELKAWVANRQTRRS